MAGDKLPIAILWHQHQPFYRARWDGDPRGSYILPWVRLHAIRDYYSMAALVGEFPNVHVTVNLVPSLILQLEDYVENGATDLLQELSIKPVEKLSGAERDFIVARFFDANWENEITVHAGYARLLHMRRAGRHFADRDITDLRMWFNLAWFTADVQRGPVDLPDGSTVDVSDFMKKGHGFTVDDIAAVLGEQQKLMRNVVPIHKQLMEAGQLEICVTPFYHPILPLVADSDLATIDAEGATLPHRFSRPEDARAQIEKAIVFYEERFGRPPRGMWPSEGSVGQHVAHLFVDAGLDWIATDQGVLKRSGKWGYNTADPEVLARAYRIGDEEKSVSAFFRHTQLSDDIGFALQGYADYDRAADDYLMWIKDGYARIIDDRGEHILSIILDGENAWGSYRNRGTAFLRGLYKRLADDPDLVSVTFSEFIDGNESRGIRPHPTESRELVSPLYCASWIDEMGSDPGNDLNIWIGSPQENRAWELLGKVRDHMEELGATPESHPDAYESIYRAEGSDWFWWFGDDFVQPTGGELVFDHLFREHLKDVYRQLGEEPPAELDSPIALDIVIWTPTDPAVSVGPGQVLRIVLDRPGTIRWTKNEWARFAEVVLVPAGDVMSNRIGYVATIGPFGDGSTAVEFHLVEDADGASGQQDGGTVLHRVPVED
ncbi:hypothetical protein KAW64_08795 [bacterium]|nr:hypothetical protein [bacterium]